MSKPTNSRRKTETYDLYREILAMPELAEREIDEMRTHVIRLAQTICEHVWGKKLY